MKATVFFLTIIFAFPLFLCAGNLAGEASEYEKSTDTLYIMGSGHRYVNGELITVLSELVFTGEDIISFNLTTREIVLTDPVYKKFG